LKFKSKKKYWFLTETKKTAIVDGGTIIIRWWLFTIGSHFSAAFRCGETEVAFF